MNDDEFCAKVTDLGYAIARLAEQDFGESAQYILIVHTDKQTSSIGNMDKSLSAKVLRITADALDRAGPSGPSN